MMLRMSGCIVLWSAVVRREGQRLEHCYSTKENIAHVRSIQKLLTLHQTSGNFTLGNVSLNEGVATQSWSFGLFDDRHDATVKSSLQVHELSQLTTRPFLQYSYKSFRKLLQLPNPITSSIRLKKISIHTNLISNYHHVFNSQHRCPSQPGRRRRQWRI